MSRQSVAINGMSWLYSGTATAFPTVAANRTVRGASGVNTQLAGQGGDTLVGGGGGSDNVFLLTGTDVAVAGAGDGVDTVIAYGGTLVLAGGISNGVLKGSGTLIGNAGDNILTAMGTGTHRLVAGAGHDLLVGATGGTDRFVVDATAASDAIMGFEHGTDVVELDNTTLSSFAAVKAAMTQVGSTVVLSLGGNQSLTFADQTIAQFTAADFALPVNLASRTMTFDDEFNSLSASASGQNTTWRFMTGTLASNHEAQNYVADTPFSIKDGVLDITASPVSTADGLPYTSGGLTTKYGFAQTYGTFEMRAQMPAGAGMWPAFWLLPADGSWPPELDAPEVLGNDPTTVYFSTHSKLGATQTVGVKLADTSAGFHTYAVDWEPDTITYYFDGNAVASLATPADMNKPMYMVLNLAVGGAGSWPGAAAGESGHMLVDYVRAYASDATPGYASAVSRVVAAPVALTLTGWGNGINKPTGTFSVTGNGGGGFITLGNGNQSVQLSAAAGTQQGSHNTVTLGSGNHSVTTKGDSNVITVGAGTSTIDAGVNYNRVTIAGGTGTNVLRASGYGNSFTETGAGNVSISGGTGKAVVTLGAGNHAVALGGGGNTVHVGAGSSTITVSGTGNILDAGPGSNVLNGGAGQDVFILNKAGQGLDTITGFKTTNLDKLDLGRALAGVGANTIGQFLVATRGAAGTTLSIDATGHAGAGSAVALLSGVQTSVADLLAHGSLKFG